MKITKSQLREIIREEIDNLKEKVSNSSVLFKEKTTDGYYKVVMKRDTTNMRGKQDEFSMKIIDKNGVVKKDWGTHPSLKGAVKFLKNK